MGRKIPAKKHRGVKDPLKQQALRLQKLKVKINAPPKDPDEQPVPHSVTRLFEFQEKKPIEKNKKNKRRGFKRDVVKGNPITQLKQLPGESGRAFSLRINSAIRGLNNPMEHQLYPQQVDESDQQGRRMEEQRARREAKRRRANKAKPPQVSAGPKREPPSVPALSTPPKPEVQYERLAFGEVAHEPPSLRKPSRAPPAGTKRDLLLNRLLEGDRESARLAAVAAYRALKARRHLV